MPDGVFHACCGVRQPTKACVQLLVVSCWWCAVHLFGVWLMVVCVLRCGQQAERVCCHAQARVLCRTPCSPRGSVTAHWLVFVSILVRPWPVLMLTSSLVHIATLWGPEARGRRL
jgi:hypothetical protein